MSDKLIYQVDQLEEKLARLHSEFDELNKQVTKVEKNLITLKGETQVVEKAVTSINSNTGWVVKVILAGFITAFTAWIVSGGLSSFNVNL